MNTSILDHLAPNAPSMEQLADVRRQLDNIEAHISGPRPDAAKASATVGASAPAVTATVTRRRKRTGKDTPAMTTTVVHTASGTPAPNVPPIERLIAQAEDLGRQAGQGKDTQVKFDLVLAEAGYVGSLDVQANKHGQGIDDAVRVAAAYVKAQQGAIIFDLKAPNQRKTISNARKMIRLGGIPKFGPGEPLQTLNTLVTNRQKLRQDPINAKKLDDAHNMLLRYATAQLKSDTLISDDAELRSFMYKTEAGQRDAEDVLESVRKTLTNLKLGKISNCPDVDNSPEVQNAIKALTTRLSAIAKARAPAQSAPVTTK